MRPSKISATLGAKPRRLKGRKTEDRSRSRITRDSPWTVGTVDTRMSTRRSPAVTRMRPSWGRRRLAIMQDAVQPVADPEAILVGLDVDVRGLRGHRLVDQQADQPDDGRLEGHVAKLVDVRLTLTIRAGLRGPHALHDLLQGG